MPEQAGRADEVVAGALARRERLRAAMDELERSAAAAAAGRAEDWRTRVADAVNTLSRVWDEHVAETEADDGAFDEILEHAPRLQHTVDRLRDDHAAVPPAIDGLRAMLAGGEDAAGVRVAAVALFTRLAEHRQLGADLLYEAFSVDLGAGDG